MCLCNNWRKTSVSSYCNELPYSKRLDNQSVTESSNSNTCLYMAIQWGGGGIIKLNLNVNILETGHFGDEKHLQKSRKRKADSLTERMIATC